MDLDTGLAETCGDDLPSHEDIPGPSRIGGGGGRRGRPERKSARMTVTGAGDQPDNAGRFTLQY